MVSLGEDGWNVYSSVPGLSGPLQRFQCVKTRSLDGDLGSGRTKVSGPRLVTRRSRTGKGSRLICGSGLDPRALVPVLPDLE